MAAAAVLAGLAVTACGQEDSSAPEPVSTAGAERGEFEQAAAEAVLAFYDDLRTGDGESLCETTFHLDADGRPTYRSGAACARLPEPAQPSIGAVRVESVDFVGTRARVEVSIPRRPGAELRDVRRFEVRRIDGRWRVRLPPLGVRD